MNALKQLVDRLSTQGYLSKVILTSTWRMGCDSEVERCSPQVQNLILKLGKSNIHIHDKTPVYKGKTRDVEILRYIRGYQLKFEDVTYVILDDDTSEYDKTALGTMNFYKVNQHTGLTIKDVKKIVKMVG